MRVGFAVPRTDDIAVAPEGNEGTRRWPDNRPRHQSKITAGRLTHNDQTIWVDVEKFRAALTDPGRGVLEIFEDLREFGFRCEAVIDRDDDVTGFEQGFE